MIKIVTARDCDGTIYAFFEGEEIPDLNEAEDYIWQLAESKESAISSHDEKLDQWVSDINAGRSTKDAY